MVDPKVPVVSMADGKVVSTVQIIHIKLLGIHQI